MARGGENNRKALCQLSVDTVGKGRRIGIGKGERKGREERERGKGERNGKEDVGVTGEGFSPSPSKWPLLLMSI